MIDVLRCGLFGHEWRLKPGMVPEDRQTYKCRRCGDFAYNPPRVGENRVPESQQEGSV